MGDSIAGVWSALVGGASTTAHCLTGSGGVLECQGVWGVLLAMVVVLAALTILYVVRRVIRDYRNHQQGVKHWQAKQTVAVKERRGEEKMRGNNATSESQSQPVRGQQNMETPLVAEDSQSTLNGANGSL